MAPITPITTSDDVLVDDNAKAVFDYKQENYFTSESPKKYEQRNDQFAINHGVY